MKTTIAKEFKWEMSHRLPFHDGPCRNIHGHTYRMRIEITGEPNENGMVMDYFTLKKIVEPLLEMLDHSFICDEMDTELIEFIKKMNFKHVIIPYYSTAENIAEYITSKLKEEIEQFRNIYSYKVRIYETEDVFAELLLEITK